MRRLNFLYIKDIVTRVWKLKNGFTMRNFGERMFNFKFTTVEDKQTVLDMGCYHIANNLFIVRSWHLFVVAGVKRDEDDPYMGHH